MPLIHFRAGRLAILFVTVMCAFCAPVRAAGQHCAGASSPIEKRICADAALAPLEQQILDIYQRQLTEVGEAYRERLQALQQAWLAGLSEGPGLKSMLEARLEALRHTVVTINTVSLLRLDGDAHPPYVLSPLPGAALYNHWVDRVWQDLRSDLSKAQQAAICAAQHGDACDSLSVQRRYTLDYVSPEVLSLDAVLTEQAWREAQPVSSDQHLHWWLSRPGQIKPSELFTSESYRRVIASQVRHYLHEGREGEEINARTLRDAQNPASWALGAQALTVTGQGIDYGLGRGPVEIPVPWKLFADSVDTGFLQRMQRYPDWPANPP